MYPINLPQPLLSFDIGAFTNLYLIISTFRDISYKNTVCNFVYYIIKDIYVLVQIWFYNF